MDANLNFKKQRVGHDWVWRAIGVNHYEITFDEREEAFIARSSCGHTSTHRNLVAAISKCLNVEATAKAKPGDQSTSCNGSDASHFHAKPTPSAVKELLEEFFGKSIEIDVETAMTLQSLDCPVFSKHFTNSESRPDGGSCCGFGFAISWQRGPVVNDGIVERNGAFVTDVLHAVQDRLKHYQDGPFKCMENDEALFYIHKALGALERRAQQRRERGVYGTHKV